MLYISQIQPYPLVFYVGNTFSFAKCVTMYNKTKPKKKKKLLGALGLFGKLILFRSNFKHKKKSKERHKNCKKC